MQVYRDGSVLSAWGTSTAQNDTGLTPNTAYTYTIEARDNNGALAAIGTISPGPRARTLSGLFPFRPAPPALFPAKPTLSPAATLPGLLSAASEPETSNTIAMPGTNRPLTRSPTPRRNGPQAHSTPRPQSGGTWYLHAKGYNGADVGNGTYNYAITATEPQTQTLQISSIVNSNGMVSLTWNSVSGLVYRVQYTPDLGGDTWSNLVPDVQAIDTTASTSDDTGGAIQRFYRVILLP